MSAFLTAQLAAAAARGAAATPGWYAERRHAAHALLVECGLPTPRDEAWKYTPLKALDGRALAVGEAVQPALRTDPPPPLAAADCDRVVLVNGRLCAELTQRRVQPGVRIEPLAQAIARGDEALRALLAAPRRGRALALAELNTLLADDGLCVQVDPGVAAARPLELLCLGAPAARDLAWYARVVVVLGAGASLRLVERHESAGAHAHLGNLVSQWRIGPQARLEYLRVQDEAAQASLYHRHELALDDAARVDATLLELGAGFARVEYAAELVGAQSRLVLRGVDAARGRQHHDVHVMIGHRARATLSETTWRGIADQRARLVFGGRIEVQAGADGADASLSNKNLLLSAHAEIDTRPVLEIHADEVSASHGATVGQLDEQALYYLRTRGIPAGQARAMLTQAFAQAVLGAAGATPFATELATRLASRLNGQAAEDTR